MLCWPGRVEGVGFPAGLVSHSLEEVRPLCSQCDSKTVEGASQGPTAPGGECALQSPCGGVGVEIHIRNTSCNSSLLGSNSYMCG